MDGKMMSKTVFGFIEDEKTRQNETINLIASENYSSKEVRQAAASVFTDKYAEGYPGRRYYSGCQNVDRVEQYAIDGAKKLFGAEHANVQPHSGSNANLAVYMSCLQPGDTVLGMALDAGGHLTHGFRLNISGKLFNFVSYGVDKETETLDYDQIEELVIQHKPKLIVAGASAYPRVIDFKRLGNIAKKYNTLLMADMAHIAGLVAAGIHPSPVTYADFVTSTTHKTLRGPRGGLILCKEKHAAAIDRAVMPGTQGGPLVHLIAGKAIAFEEALQSSFADYQKQVVKNAVAMAEVFKNDGYRIISGGTDNHLFLVDVTSKKPDLHGKIVEELLENLGITLNRNMIPFDTAKPMTPSGIRIGTPAITTRGFGQDESVKVAKLICSAIEKQDDAEKLETIKKEVIKLCQAFPLHS
ncbi:serine hydroxymethyltransferase [Candidatus Babeliales bacterium]|nr:serine hydroxymethyltransferase [Candidatus Babeliales bacterium]